MSGVKRERGRSSTTTGSNRLTVKEHIKAINAE